MSRLLEAGAPFAKNAFGASGGSLSKKKLTSKRSHNISDVPISASS